MSNINNNSNSSITSTTTTTTTTNNNNNNNNNNLIHSGSIGNLRESVGIGAARLQQQQSGFRIEEQYIKNLLANAKDPKNPQFSDIIQVYEKTYCCNDRWIIKLLNFLIGCERDSDVIGEVAITLQILAFFSITPKELKYMFRLLESVNEERPFYWSVLVELLEYIFRPREGPDCYFNFGSDAGGGGGLMIPEKAPFDGGYTFSMWISIDDFKDMRYSPILYSFNTDDDNVGLECYFQGFSLVYIIKTKNKTATQKSQFVFHPKRWYHITISHEYFMLRKSQLSFYVNAKLEEKIPLLYPKTDRPYTRCHIGNSSSFNAGFIGRMGAILMVNEALTQPEIHSIYSMGKDTSLMLEKLPREGAIGIYNGELFLESRKNIPVLFMYSPKATDKALCFEISSGELPNAATMECVNVIKTTSPIDQLLYVGGISMIYPLFAQLGHPVNGMETRPADITDQTAITSTFIEYISIPNNSATHAPLAIFPRPIYLGHPGILFRLLTTIIEYNPVYREQIIETKGFQTISFLLMSYPNSSPYWTPDDIETVGRLLSFCSSNQQLWTLAIEYLIVRNFQVWSNTHPLTQMALFESIRQRVKANTHFWRNNVKVEQWLDILRRFYSLDFDFMELSTHSNLHPHVERVKKSRSQIIVILRESCNPIFTLAETRHIALYLKESTVDNQDDLTKMLEDMIPAIHVNNAKDVLFGEIVDEPRTRQLLPTQLPLPKHLSYLWDIDGLEELQKRQDQLNQDQKDQYLLYRHWIKLRRRRAGTLSGAKVRRTLLDSQQQQTTPVSIVYRLKELGIPHSSITMANSLSSGMTFSPIVQSPATSPPLSPSSSPPKEGSGPLSNKAMSPPLSPNASTSNMMIGNNTSINTVPEIEPEDTTVIHWKLDRSEGPLRMRRKLKRNYLGSDYKGVSKQNKFGRNRRAVLDVFSNDKEKFFIDQDCGDGLGNIIIKIQLDPPLNPQTVLFKEKEFLNLSNLNSQYSDNNNNNNNNSSNNYSSSSGNISSPTKIESFSQLIRTPSKQTIQYQSPSSSSASSQIISGSGNNTIRSSDGVVIRDPSVEKVVAVYHCGMVTPVGVINGKLTITTVHILFDKEIKYDRNGQVILESDHGCVRIKNYYILKVKDLMEIHRRRYLLRWNSLEIFLNYKSYMFTFNSDSESVSAFNKIANLHPPQMKVKWSESPAKIAKRLKITQRWKNREISNFEYLMMLNTIAGRTYNDISQYPIFPQVIADYRSEQLDLNDEKSFRDLSKPIGALNQQRLDTLIQRYHSFKDPDIPPFLYGSHYSNFGIIAYYNVRLEPFTSYHLSLQGGVWDHPQRMFESIEKMWDGVVSANLADVKELTPEFFYMPEFISNSESFNFNFAHNPNGDLLLPKWAHQSPELFIQKNREALESEYVSMHLHQWIDLIFGYKQTGQAAIDSNNVFFYLTYENNSALQKEDPDERRSVESQIKEFGQTPPQVFSKPHPPRKSLQELNRPQKDILTKFANLFPNALKEPLQQQLNADVAAAAANSASGDQQQYPFKILKTNSCLPLVHIGASSESDTIVLVYRDGVLAVNQFVPTPSNNLPFTFDIDKTLSTYKEKQIDTLFMSDSVTCISNCFAMTPDGKFLFSCANWDSIFKCCNIQNGKVHRMYRDYHRGMVTCMAMGSSGRTLATASIDTTILVWDDVSMLIRDAKTKPAYRLCSHDEAVHCLDVNEEWDLIASGSQDRKLILHTLRTGSYVRTMSHKGAVEIVKISTVGQTIISYCSMSYLYVHSFNGKLLHIEQCDEKLYDIKLTGESIKKGGVLGVGDDIQYLVTGGTRGVKVRSLPDLTVVHSFESPTTIRTIALVAHEKYMMIGLNDGNLVIIPFETASF
ncbi:BEACH domain-containing protein [Heterostelium album PN500]|uniref:BEACH domain-containing protein n=1 Tax=Heterostelium pallidum (strain ATCC 26659 / Pp 5 / PN500) TaxID=670386 RepID=D3B4G5_HETP5|nr:BEACH domain-containing protein [Heterostelium album PN500]EFA84213.1 BEACH domain-containing protein [Heterostelium album PN500]|eukprot:XP_020436329.1 BEACH domain-containing protein [Heterostelium album PN500]